MTQHGQAQSIAAAGHYPPDWWRPALTEPERRPERGGLADTGGTYSGHSAQPDWAAYIERATAAAPTPGTAAPLAGHGRRQEEFALLLRAIAQPVAERLAEHAARLPRIFADAGAVTGGHADALGARLTGIATRTLMYELEDAPGDEPVSLAALMTRYPVLARLLGTAALAAADAGTELLDRLAADYEPIVQTLLGGSDPGPVTEIVPGLGDPHRHGRCVTLVRFADGRSVVYKPRGVEMHARFARVLAWLNSRISSCELYSPLLLSRPDHGWMEFIAARPLEQPADAHRFYQRAGVLLAALNAVHALDMHCENLVACGDQPVLIDVETLFHPTLPNAELAVADPAAEALLDSVLRTGLLPRLTVTENGVFDVSGLGGGDDHADRLGNRPHFGGRTLEPADFADDLLEGFRLGYDAIVRDRSGFVLLAEDFANLETRVVTRPSRAYQHLLEETMSPELLRDARDRDAAFDVLDEASAGHPLWRLLAPHERTALWRGDIPLVTARIGDRDLRTCTGGYVPQLLERSGLVCALAKTVGMGEVDQSEQEWLIAASLSARRPAAAHRCSPTASLRPAPAAAEPGRLLAAASGLADQIVARANRRRTEPGSGRLNWLGLQLVEDFRWMVLPMGAGLGDGYLGVALFLAQLAELTGIARYAEIAREAVEPVPALFAAIADRPDLLAAVGCGGIDGLGGMAYGLARLGSLLDDAEVRDWTGTAVELAAAAAGATEEPWWTTGLAGCLAAMTAVHARADAPAAARAATLAAECAKRLTELVEYTAGSCRLDEGPERRGFAGGTAGVGWALARHASAAGDLTSRQAADRALRHALAGDVAQPKDPSTKPACTEPSADIAGFDEDPGWCQGSAGLLLARAALPQGFAGVELEAAVDELADRPVLSDLSLCHGELGIADALVALGTHVPRPAEHRARRRRAGLALEALHHGTGCATPDGVATPGLLHGLAGIGYGLLRLGFADRVPSVLLLEAAPAAPAHQG